MLLAKIRDKLFNRRNSVEIMSLQGDVEVDGNVLAKNLKSSYIVEDVKNISETILSKLKAGDLVIKQDSSGNHTYVVSFNKDNTGLCLTYTDASVVETQSYDYTAGHWVYNSEDKIPLVDVESASAGTIVDALGLDEDGKLVKGSVGGGGTQLYRHYIYDSQNGYGCYLVSTASSLSSISVDNIISCYFKTGGSITVNSVFIKANYEGRVVLYFNKLNSGFDDFYIDLSDSNLSDTVTSL